MKDGFLSSHLPTSYWLKYMNSYLNICLFSLKHFCEALYLFLPLPGAFLGSIVPLSTPPWSISGKHCTSFYPSTLIYRHYYINKKHFLTEIMMEVHHSCGQGLHKFNNENRKKLCEIFRT